jgi:hypothetical protein
MFKKFIYKLMIKWFPDDIRVPLPDIRNNPNSQLYQGDAQLDADAEMLNVIRMIEGNKTKITAITYTKSDTSGNFAKSNSSGNFGPVGWGYFVVHNLEIHYAVGDPTSILYNTKGMVKLTSRVNKFGDDTLPSNDDITRDTYNRMLEILENILDMPIEDFTEAKFFYI